MVRHFVLAVLFYSALHASYAEQDEHHCSISLPVATKFLNDLSVGRDVREATIARYEKSKKIFKIS